MLWMSITATSVVPNSMLSSHRCFEYENSLFQFTHCCGYLRDWPVALKDHFGNNYTCLDLWTSIYCNTSLLHTLQCFCYNDWIYAHFNCLLRPNRLVNQNPRLEKPEEIRWHRISMEYQTPFQAETLLFSSSFTCFQTFHGNVTL